MSTGPGEVQVYSVTKRISFAVGSRELVEIYEELVADDPVPLVKLIDLSIRLDKEPVFPEAHVLAMARDLRKRELAMQVLRSMVILRFELFAVPRETIQRVCDKLQISYSLVRTATAGRVR